MIYSGPGLAAEILREMSATLKRDGVGNISALRDRDLADWAAKDIPA